MLETQHPLPTQPLSPHILHSTKGVTLLEILIGLSITGILTLGVATFMSQQTSTVNDLKFAMNMKRIAERLERASLRPDVIRASADYSSMPGNKALKACIDRPVQSATKPGLVDDALCTATDPEKQKPIQLILPLKEQNLRPDEIISHTIAGTDDKPVRYSLRDDNHCHTPDPDSPCPLEARAFFWASCPADSSFLGAKDAHSSEVLPGFTPATCPTAQTIHIRYQLIHTPIEGKHTEAQTKTLRTLPSIPPDEKFWKDKGKRQMSTFGAMSIDVAVITAESSYRFACPPNYTVTGIKDGKPICECLYPFKEQTKDGVKTCLAEEQICGPRQRYRGTTTDGDIKCVDVTCTPHIDLHQGCSYGGWMESITTTNASADNPHSQRPNSCVATICSVDKNGGTCKVNVDCKTKVTCCYEAVTSP